jgi:hypothetical protein
MSKNRLSVGTLHHRSGTLAVACHGLNSKIMAPTPGVSVHTNAIESTAQ